MVNYENGKIYKIVCDDQVYIGSTCEQHLSQRLAQHRSKFQSFKGGKCGNSAVFSLFWNGITRPEIYLIEEYACKSKEQLLLRERHHIENTDCINKCKKPILTEAEVQTKFDSSRCQLSKSYWKLKHRLENMKKEISLIEEELK